MDRDDAVSESNESNNLATLPVCVGVTCEPDAFEDDNALADAKWIVENTAQAHTLCHPTNDTEADTDTVKFSVFDGITYTLAATNVGAHANPALALNEDCGLTASTSEDSLTWHSSASTICHATVMQEGDPVGPLAAYSLTLSSETGITDDYEPDNQCATARDIPTGPDDDPQTHLFQAPADEDWVKFSIAAGDSFIVLADTPGPGVSPVVTIFSSCNQVDASNSLADGSQQISYSSTTDNDYYAHVKNQNPDNFGSNAHYNLHVIASTCTADDQEPDNASGQAKTVTVGADPRRTPSVRQATRTG